MLLLALILAIALIPPWKRTGIPQPPPRGHGIAVGYGLGGREELDQFDSAWYIDYDFRGAPLGSHRRLRMVSADTRVATVRTVAREHPGEWWQFGNEPNDPHQDNISPAEYARRYHAFYFTVKSADSTARVVPAGIADADWQWAGAFREAYRTEFGWYPRVDGWSIHNYLLDTCEIATDVGIFQSRLLAFRAWMDRSGGAGKPLLLTEYGVLYGSGCCNCPMISEGQVVEFMRAATNWMRESRSVDGWAWFALRTDGRYNGDLLTDRSAFTPFGLAYRGLVQAGAPAEGDGKMR